MLAETHTLAGTIILKSHHAGSSHTYIYTYIYIYVYIYICTFMCIYVQYKIQICSYNGLCIYTGLYRRCFGVSLVSFLMMAAMMLKVHLQYVIRSFVSAR